VYLLDTNLASLFDPRRQVQHRPVIDWMARNDRLLTLSVVSLVEIESGLLKLLREGKAARALEIQALGAGLLDMFADRLLPVDSPIALATARLSEAIRPMVLEWKDLLIAATAVVHGLTVLTRNLRHFQPTGVAALDPLAGLPPEGASASRTPR
jgi:toxin FitB